MSRWSCVVARLLVVALAFFLLGPALAADGDFVLQPATRTPVDIRFDANVIVPPAELDRNGNHVADALEAAYRKNGKAGLQSKAGPPTVDVMICLDHAPTAADLARYQALGATKLEAWSDLVYVIRARFPAALLPPAALEQLGGAPGVVWIEENAAGRPSAYGATRQVGARRAWASGWQGNPDDAVAIMDTGLDATHKDFAGRIAGWVDFAGVDAVIDGDESPTPIDRYGHGSAVAGLAAGDGAAAGTVTGVGTLNLSAPAPLDPFQGATIFPIDTTAATAPSTLTASLKWETSLPNGVHSLQFFGDDASGLGLFGSGWTPATAAQPFSLTVNTVPPGIFSSSFLALFGTSITANFSSGALPAWLQIGTPMSAVGDGFRLMSGMAPRCKIVGVRIGDDVGNLNVSGFLNGVAWINANRRSLNIACANVSLTFGVTSPLIDTLVNQLVRNGVVWVNAAGNERFFGAGIFAPASAARAIAVGATDDLDLVTYYSSYGSTSQRKPDLVAPGGSDFPGMRPLAVVDSNSADDDGVTGGLVPDKFANDYVQEIGTSFSSPIVAGAVMLLVQALEAQGRWNTQEEDPTRREQQALLVKMLLLMTASETGPAAELTPSPTVERGGRDRSEGFGRLNVDAAIEAVSLPFDRGTPSTATLGPDARDRKVWARNLTLHGGIKYGFSLANPANADLDLYLYADDPVGTSTSEGEPQLVAKSAQSRWGGVEVLEFTPVTTARYYLVVKYLSGRDTATFQLSGGAVADFALSLSPAEQVLEAKGDNVRFAVSLSALAGFQDLVTLAIGSALPAGVRAQFDRLTLSPGETATLILTTSAATPSSPLSFVVRGTAGDQTREAAGRVEIGPEWPRFHHDGHGSGRSAFRGPQAFRLAWSAFDGAALVSSPAIGADGTIYHGTRRFSSNIGGYFDAWSPRDGSLVWDFAIPGGAGVDSSPTVGIDGTIYFGADDGRLYALRSDGNLKWQFQLGTEAVTTAPLIGADGTVYVAAGGKLHAMSPDGVRKWTYIPAGATLNSSPALGADGTLYYGIGNAAGSAAVGLLALRDTGAAPQLKWQFATVGSVLSSPAVISDGRIYFGSNGDSSGGRFYVVRDDGFTATLLTATTTRGAVRSSPSIGPDGSVYVGDDSGRLYALTGNGTTRWIAATAGPIVSTPAIDRDGNIFYTAGNRALYALSDQGENFGLLWSVLFSSDVQSSPAISASGALYVTTLGGSIYAFQDDAPANFDVSVNPVLREALVGGTASYTVTLRSINVSGPVALAVEGTLPDGVTASFSPATANLPNLGSATVTLRLTSTTAALGGESLFRVRATAGGAVRESELISLVLRDYTLGAQPAVRRISAGQSTQFSITPLPNPASNSATTTSFFGARVDLAVNVVTGPTGGTPPTLAIEQRSLTIPGLTTLTAATTMDTPPGTYLIEVRGLSNGVTRAATVKLVVDAPP
jgi:outer membrane protein assembly factor BamB/subtilisin family serine protease